MQSSRPRLKACRPKLIIRNTALLYNLGKVLFKVRDTSFLQTTVKNVDPPCCHLTSRPRPNGRGFPGKPLRDLCSPSMARNVVQTPNAAHLANLASIFLERTKKRFKTLGGRTALLRYKNPRNLDALRLTPSRVCRLRTWDKPALPRLSGQYFQRMLSYGRGGGKRLINFYV